MTLIENPIVANKYVIKKYTRPGLLHEYPNRTPDFHNHIRWTRFMTLRKILDGRLGIGDI